jgi:hypothetical protein
MHLGYLGIWWTWKGLKIALVVGGSFLGSSGVLACADTLQCPLSPKPSAERDEASCFQACLLAGAHQADRSIDSNDTLQSLGYSLSVRNLHSSTCNNIFSDPRRYPCRKFIQKIQTAINRNAEIHSAIHTAIQTEIQTATHTAIQQHIHHFEILWVTLWDSHLLASQTRELLDFPPAPEVEHLLQHWVATALTVQFVSSPAFLARIFLRFLTELSETS